MNKAKALFFAARPKTLPASLSPVFLGGKIAHLSGSFSPLIFSLTLLFALFIQIGANYANDYFDFCKGVDTSARTGPKRAVQQGWLSPGQMWHATLFAFALALLFATPLMWQAGLWSLAVALLCILLGILYPGGPKPLGSLALGELLVFFFFGPVALLGTYFLQTGHLTSTACLASLPPGLLSSCILIANNLRDFTTDMTSGKKTLIVRLGLPFGRHLFTLSLVSAFFFSLLLSPLLAIPFLLAPPLLFLLYSSRYLPLLPATALFLSLYTLFFLGI
ncbi:MAG: 1,4-dihydroxy-2-naphthoate octaprenyltransferase [Verrucomicrobiota bacterium]|nr:1,4-dihydroxy-2-naphthoate octaprenyltransferase [Verrucomicrobiota bacterium]